MHKPFPINAASDDSIVVTFCPFLCVLPSNHSPFYAETAASPPSPEIPAGKRKKKTKIIYAISSCMHIKLFNMDNDNFNKQEHINKYIQNFGRVEFR